MNLQENLQENLQGNIKSALTSKEEKTKRATYSLDSDILRAFNKKCKAENVKMSQVINEFMKMYAGEVK